MVKTGIPLGLQSSAYSISNIIIQSSVNLLGTLCVAGNSAAGNLEMFVYTSMNSFTQGCMTFAGQNYGAGRYERLNKIYKAGLLCAAVVGLGMGFSCFFGGNFLLGIYLPTSAAAVAFGMIRISVLVTTDAVCGLMDCSTGMLRGINRSVFPMFATIAGSCVLRIVWAFTVFRGFLETAPAQDAYRILLISYPVSWALTFAALLVYYIIVRRKIPSRIV